MRISWNRVLAVTAALTWIGCVSVSAQHKQKPAPAPPQQAPGPPAPPPNPRAPQPSQPQMGPTPGPGADTLPEEKNPYTNDREAIRDGRLYFQWYNCSGCHGDHGGGGMGPSLRDSVWIYGGTDARIFNSIFQGRTKGMPSWGAKVPADQIWKMVAYIKSLRTPREPDKP
jgi:cytochrome c oxidase cbb3-type subunit III